MSAELINSPHRTIAITGAIDGIQERADQRVVNATIAEAFSGVPFTVADAVWSDPIGLPAAHGSKTVPLVQAAAMGQVNAHAKLTAGAWPAGVTSAARGPVLVQAAVPASVATTLALSVGQVLVLRDRQNSAKVRFEVTGLYRPLNQAEPYWSLDLISPAGSGPDRPGRSHVPAR